MTNLHLTDEQIAICAEATNNVSIDSLPESIKEHLKECDECAHHVLAVSETILDLSENETIKSAHHYNFTKKALAVAASLAIIVTASFYLNSILQSNNNLISEKHVDSTSLETGSTSNDIETLNSTGQPTDQQPEKIKNIIPVREQDQPNHSNNHLLAYAPNEQLDKLCERFMGAAMRDDDVKVVSPALIESNSSQVELKWKNHNNQLLIIEIYDNGGEIIGEHETTRSSFKPNNLTTAGLYYWKLLNEDFDLLFCGKISIK